MATVKHSSNQPLKFDGWTWQVIDTWLKHGAVYTVRHFARKGIPASMVLNYMRGELAARRVWKR